MTDKEVEYGEDLSCETCPENNNAEWDERSCPFKAMGCCCKGEEK